MSSSESRDCMNPSHDTARSSRRQEHVKDLRKRDKFCMICRRKEYALTCGVAKKCSAVQNRRIFGRRAIPFGDGDVRLVGCAEKVVDLVLASAGGTHPASGHAFNRDNVHALVEEVMRSPRLLRSVDIPEEGGDEDAPVRALLGGHNPENTCLGLVGLLSALNVFQCGSVLYGVSCAYSGHLTARSGCFRPGQLCVAGGVSSKARVDQPAKGTGRARACRTRSAVALGGLGASRHSTKITARAAPSSSQISRQSLPWGSTGEGSGAGRAARRLDSVIECCAGHAPA